MKDDAPEIACIVIGGNSISLYTIQGTNSSHHCTEKVNLPKKHGRGGQSKLRFERLAEEARHRYIVKSAKLVTDRYPPGIKAIIGGPAGMKERLKTALSEANIDVIKTVDIQYEERAGLYEILSQSTDIFNDLKISKEREIMTKFFDEVIRGTLAIYGKKQVTDLLNSGLLKQLIIHEETALEIDDEEMENIIKLCEKYHTEILTVSSLLPEAEQLRSGFGGVVGILQYALNFDDTGGKEDDDEEYVW